VCPCRSRIFSLILTGKGKEREDASHVGRMVTSGIIAQIWPNPKRGGVKARRLQVSRLGMILQVKMNRQGRAAPDSSSRSSRSSHKCLMAKGKTSIPSSSDDSDDGEGVGKASLEEFAEAVKFFEDVCTKQKAQIKTFKNKWLSSQNDYKCLLEKFEIFANLNCELTTKIEQLESKAPSSATDDSLIKKNEKLKAKLASSENAMVNLLEKMKILSIHNNELTTKLESIGSTPGASLVEIPKIIKKDASTSCFNLIDDSNFCNQVLVKNVVIETCSDEIAMDNEQLRQEVARLGKALYDKKGKAKQTQPP
jgi:hypothetical protein